MRTRATVFRSAPLQFKRHKIVGRKGSPSDFAYGIMMTIVDEANSALDVFKGCVYACRLRDGAKMVGEFQQCLKAFVNELYEINRSGTHVAGLLMQSLGQGETTKSHSFRQQLVDNTGVSQVIIMKAAAVAEQGLLSIFNLTCAVREAVSDTPSLGLNSCVLNLRVLNSFFNDSLRNLCRHCKGFVENFYLDIWDEGPEYNSLKRLEDGFDAMHVMENRRARLEAEEMRDPGASTNAKNMLG